MPCELEGLDQRELVHSLLLWRWVEEDAMEEEEANAKREAALSGGNP